MWQFLLAVLEHNNFLAVQIFRKIYFDKCWHLKMSNFTILEALIFRFCENLIISKSWNFLKLYFEAHRIVKMSFFETSLVKTDFTENMSSWKIPEFLHCASRHVSNLRDDIELLFKYKYTVWISNPSNVLNWQTSKICQMTFLPLG